MGLKWGKPVAPAELDVLVACFGMSGGQCQDGASGARKGQSTGQAILTTHKRPVGSCVSLAQKPSLLKDLFGRPRATVYTKEIPKV